MSFNRWGTGISWVMRRHGMAWGAQQARGVASSTYHGGECEQRTRVCVLVCVLYLDKPVCLYCMSGCARHTALSVNSKTLRNRKVAERTESEQHSLNCQNDASSLFSPLSHPPDAPLCKVSLGSRICPHKKQKSADVV